MKENQIKDHIIAKIQERIGDNIALAYLVTNINSGGDIFAVDEVSADFWNWVLVLLLGSNLNVMLIILLQRQRSRLKKACLIGRLKIIRGYVNHYLSFANVPSGSFAAVGAAMLNDTSLTLKCLRR